MPHDVPLSGTLSDWLRIGCIHTRARAPEPAKRLGALAFSVSLTQDPCAAHDARDTHSERKNV